MTSCENAGCCSQRFILLETKVSALESALEAADVQLNAFNSENQKLKQLVEYYSGINEIKKTNEAVQTDVSIAPISHDFDYKQESDLLARGFVYDLDSSMYYNASTGYYYDTKTSYYYHPSTQLYYGYDEASGGYKPIESATDTNQHDSDPIQSYKDVFQKHHYRRWAAYHRFPLDSSIEPSALELLVDLCDFVDSRCIYDPSSSNNDNVDNTDPGTSEEAVYDNNMVVNNAGGCAATVEQTINNEFASETYLNTNGNLNNSMEDSDELLASNIDGSKNAAQIVNNNGNDIEHNTVQMSTNINGQQASTSQNCSALTGLNGLVDYASDGEENVNKLVEYTSDSEETDIVNKSTDAITMPSTLIEQDNNTVEMEDSGPDTEFDFDEEMIVLEEDCEDSEDDHIAINGDDYLCNDSVSSDHSNTSESTTYLRQFAKFVHQRGAWLSDDEHDAAHYQQMEATASDSEECQILGEYESEQNVVPYIRVIVSQSTVLPVGALHVITLDGAVIGRDPSCDVVIPVVSVSKRHARISYNSEFHTYVIEDLDSRNGTWLNGVLLPKGTSCDSQDSTDNPSTKEPPNSHGNNPVTDNDVTRPTSYQHDPSCLEPPTPRMSSDNHSLAAVSNPETPSPSRDTHTPPTAHFSGTILSHGDELCFAEVTTFAMHIHRGNNTCSSCEPGLIQAKAPAILQSTAVSYRINEAVNDIGEPLSSQDAEASRRSLNAALKQKYGLSGTSGNYSLMDRSQDYKDRAEHRRITRGSDFPRLPDAMPASVHRSIPSDNRGFQMLEKMGWTTGASLGRDPVTGSNQPIGATVYKSSGPESARPGLGAPSNQQVSLDVAGQGDWPRTYQQAAVTRTQERFARLEKAEKRHERQLKLIKQRQEQRQLKAKKKSRPQNVGKQKSKVQLPIKGRAAILRASEQRFKDIMMSAKHAKNRTFPVKPGSNFGQGLAENISAEFALSGCPSSTQLEMAQLLNKARKKRNGSVNETPEPQGARSPVISDGWDNEVMVSPTTSGDCDDIIVLD